MYSSKSSPFGFRFSLTTESVIILGSVIDNSQFSPEKENGLVFGGSFYSRQGRGTDQLKIFAESLYVRTNRGEAGSVRHFSQQLCLPTVSTAFRLTSRSQHQLAQLSSDRGTWQGRIGRWIREKRLVKETHDVRVSFVAPRRRRRRIFYDVIIYRDSPRAASRPDW